MNTSLFSKTPTVTVLNNRGLTILNVAYHRHPESPDVTTELITRHQYDTRGFLTQSADPRLAGPGWRTSHTRQICAEMSCVRRGQTTVPPSA